MPATRRTPAEMLAELEETLSVTRVYEGRLLNEDAHVYGLCVWARHSIHVDVATVTVGVVLHELLHARYPSWSERRVEREAGRLLSSMSGADVDRWYRRYRRVKKTRRRMSA